MQELRSAAAADAARLAHGRSRLSTLGTGLRGFTAANESVQAGPLIVASSRAGGRLMRSIERGGFTLDVDPGAAF
jgi:hypothetical protein